MITDSPTCPNPFQCAPGVHEGWRHATSWVEVQEVLELGREVRDRDGDKILGVEHKDPDSTVWTIYYKHRSSDLISDYDNAEVDYLLIPDVAVVTDQEMSEVLASLAKAKPVSEH